MEDWNVHADVGSVNGTTFLPATNTSTMLRSSPAKEQENDNWHIREMFELKSKMNKLKSKLTLTQIQELFQKKLKSKWLQIKLLNWNKSIQFYQHVSR